MASALFQMMNDCASDARKFEDLKSSPDKFMSQYDLTDEQKGLIHSALSGRQHDLLKALGDEVFKTMAFC